MTAAKNPFAPKAETEETAAPAKPKTTRKAPVKKAAAKPKVEETVTPEVEADEDFDVLTAPVPEEEVEDGAAEEQEAEEVVGGVLTTAPEVEEKPAKKATRRTASQADAEAAEREAKMREEFEAKIAELAARIPGATGDAPTEITVVSDEVVADADRDGGEVRLLADRATFMNDDWRLTRNGLTHVLGRVGGQAGSNVALPTSLMSSLYELLTAFVENSTEV